MQGGSWWADLRGEVDGIAALARRCSPRSHDNLVFERRLRPPRSRDDSAPVTGVGCAWQAPYGLPGEDAERLREDGALAVPKRSTRAFARELVGDVSPSADEVPQTLAGEHQDTAHKVHDFLECLAALRSS